MMNRKARKKRKMQLRRKGMEAYMPPWDSLIMTSIGNLPFKIARHFKDGSIMAGKMRGYEFLRLRKKDR